MGVTYTNLGVNGNNECVVFTVSRTPRDYLALMGTGNIPSEPVCDLRRITYAVTEAGLVRKEDKDITNPAYALPLTSIPGDLGDTAKNVIAKQVSKMSIRYFGPNEEWSESWDGTSQQTVGTNSTTQMYAPQGPPALIEFTFTLKLQPHSVGGAEREVTVVHSVAIQTANRFVPQSLTTTAP